MVLEGYAFPFFLFSLEKEYGRALAGNRDIVQKDQRSISPFACSKRKYKRKTNWCAARNRSAWSKGIYENTLKLPQTKAVNCLLT